jgi:Tfp pilus assembly protein PilN
MKAVNLIPSEERIGGAGRTGGAVYAVLGVLGVAVLLVSAYVLANHSVSSKRNELARVTAEANATQAKASALQGYTSFSTLRQKREQTVQSIVDSRFDWAHALHEVSRTIPDNAWLTTLTGTVAPGVQVQGGSGSGTSLRSALPVPAIDVVGCTTSQKSVARMMAHMRLIDGVQSVALASSEKADQATGGSSTGGGASGGSSSDCREGTDHYPQFSLTIFFKAAPTASAPGATGTAAAGTAATASAPAGAGQSTPAVTTTGGSK